MTATTSAALTYPAAEEKAWGGRLPRAESIELDDEQKAAYADVHPWSGNFAFAPTDANGGLIGPFNAIVLRPRPGLAFQQWVASDYDGSSLSRSLREVVILTVGVEWGSDFEIYAHVMLARSVGLSEEVIDDLRKGSVEHLAPEQLVAHRFTAELVHSHRVQEHTYAAALDAFGQDGVLDMTNLIGMYLAGSALLNAFEVPAPEIPAAPHRTQH